MRNLKIPVILQGLDLSEYHESLKGETLQVWVNPPLTIREEHAQVFFEWNLAEVETGKGVENKLPDEKLAAFKALRDKYEARINEWFCRIWSQGPEDSRMPLEELTVLNASDPAFVEWLKRRTMTLIEEHRREQKKA